MAKLILPWQRLAYGIDEAYTVDAEFFEAVYFLWVVLKCENEIHKNLSTMNN